jgi:hypothetical protein
LDGQFGPSPTAWSLERFYETRMSVWRLAPLSALIAIAACGSLDTSDGGLASIGVWQYDDAAPTPSDVCIDDVRVSAQRIGCGQ